MSTQSQDQEVEDNIVVEEPVQGSENASVTAEDSELENTSVPTQDDANQESATAENRFWYSIQCYSLQEYKVRERLFQLIEEGLGDKIFRVLLPEEETVEIKNNKRHEKISKIYPGYIFVEMVPDEQAWFLIKQIPGVAKLVGHGKEPAPVSQVDIDKILRKIGDKTKKIEVDFEMNEMIKAISGPFRGYSGVICEINVERGKLKALISIFGRETPVELDFDQVEKAVGS